MADQAILVDEVLQAVGRLRRDIQRYRSGQVRALEERQIVKATAFAWFKRYRPSISVEFVPDLAQSIDSDFTSLLEFSDRHIRRMRYVFLLKQLKDRLIKLRSQVVSATKQIPPASYAAPPDFSSFVADAKMQDILKRRWQETCVCLEHGAHLAATVMMGALLEALFLARCNRLDDKTDLFKAKSVPRDAKTRRPLVLKDWTLKDFIDVAHELGWIRQSAKGVSVVLRDYRNYIHPSKELAHGIVIENQDTSMFWKVFTSLAEQIMRVA